MWGVPDKEITMHKHDKAVSRALQAYEQWRVDRTNTHTFRREHGLTYKVSAIYSPLGDFKRQTMVKATFQGKYVHVQLSTKTYRTQHPNKRGVITDFSGASRRRMFDLFHRLEIKQKAVFLTLTYGQEYPDAKTAKNHLRAFLERVRRWVGNSPTAAIWRMEFQERGAPHFHIVFTGLPYIAKEEIQRAWGEICNIQQPFTRIEMIRSTRKLMNYVSKYIAKVNPPADAGDSGFNSPTYLHAYQEKHGQEIGRVWGIFQRQHLPLATEEYFEFPIHWAKFFRLRDAAIKQYAPLKDALSLSFRLYVKSARHWRQWFEKLFRDEIVYWGRVVAAHPDLESAYQIDFMHT